MAVANAQKLCRNIFQCKEAAILNIYKFTYLEDRHNSSSIS